MRSPVGITVNMTNTVKASTEQVLPFLSTTSFSIGLLVNELDGVFEPTQGFRREGAESVDGYEMEWTENIVGGLPGMGLFCALLDWAGTAVFKVAGVVDTASRPLPQDVQAVVDDMSHAPVPQLSGLRP